MKYSLNIWKSPDDGLFRFHVENEAGNTIRKKSANADDAIKQGLDHFGKSVLADFGNDPEMFNGRKE